MSADQYITLMFLIMVVAAAALIMTLFSLSLRRGMKNMRAMMPPIPPFPGYPRDALPRGGALTGELSGVSPAHVAKLRELTTVHCQWGTWNYDPYMHGMANGMIFALALMEDDTPEYLDAPDVYLVDEKNDGQ